MYRSRRRDARKKHAPGNVTGRRRPRTPSSRSSTGLPQESGEEPRDRSPSPRSLPLHPAR